MKKHLKWLSVLMVLAMLVSMATAVAEDETKYTITINNSATGHTYEAYQIFAGVYAKDENNQETLSNLTWGSGITNEGKTHFGGDAQEKADTLLVESDARNFANEVVNYLSNTKKTSTGPDEGKYTISGLDAGYYLIKETAGSLQGTYDTYSLYMMEVVGDAVAITKGNKPEFEKKIKDINDSTDTDYSNWQDSADHDIGDAIPFRLKGTIPTDYAEYVQYEYVFHDKQCSGLTFNPDSVKVSVDGTQINSGYEVKSSTDGECDYGAHCTFEIYFENLKSISAVHAGSEITVEYTATLNDNAVIGSLGNPNEGYLAFSNNPYSTDKGELGKTPVDKVIAFTYKTVINKVDEKQNPLAGAEFALTKKQADNTWETLTLVKNDEGTVFTFVGLDDGEYRFEETKAPDGYNSIEPIYFTVSATHDVEAADPKFGQLSVKDAEGNDLSIKESAEGEATDGLAGIFTVSHTDGSLITNIVNLSGAVLPSTGGIGTTIFYALGGLLVVAAAVLLITKRRMSSED